MNKISLCTSCMDRNSFISKAIKTWLFFDFSEIIIIDWSSKKSLRSIVDKYPNKNIRLIEFKHQKHYHHSRVRNIKNHFCKYEWVLSIDCDIELKHNFFDHIEFKENRFYTTPIEKPIEGIIGTSLMTKTAYNSVNGCNENMIGWGAEEIDLYKRLIVNGYNRFNIFPDKLNHINHSNESRVENCIEKNKWKSTANNNLISIKNEHFEQLTIPEYYEYKNC